MPSSSDHSNLVVIYFFKVGGAEGKENETSLFLSTSGKWTLSFLEVGQCVIKLTMKSVADVNLFHFKAFLPVDVQ